MNIEEELRLIQRKGPVDPLGQLSQAFQQAVQPVANVPDEAPAAGAPDVAAPVDLANQPTVPAAAPPAAAPSEETPPPVFDIEANDAALGLPPREAGLTAAPDADASTWDVIAAGWQAETVKTDAWNYTEGLRRDLTARMWQVLSPEAKQRIADLKWDQQNNWMRVEDLVVAEIRAAAAASPDAAAALAGLPQSPEAFEKIILEQRKQALDEASAVLDQPGGAIAEFIGSGARAMTDQASLMLLPFGLGGSAMRVIAGEAALGALGEAAVLPREFQVAQELDIEDPNAVGRIAMGAVLGGGLAGVVVGGGRAVRWARERRASAKAAAPEGVDEIDAEFSIDAAEAQMRGDQTVAEVLSRPAPGTLGDIVTPAGTRAHVVLANQGAIRRQPIQPQLEARLSEAVGEVYGEGYTVQVYSGGQPTRAEGGPRTGSDRHDHGKAADVKIFGPDGKQLTGDALAPVIQYWLAKRIGGVGAEMSGGGLHLDLHTTKAPTWDYRADGGQLTPAQAAAMEAGKRGEVPRLGGTPATPVSRLPNTPGLDYNEDATVSAIIGAESSGNAGARNPNSSAGGLGQIIDATWMDLVRRNAPDAIVGLTDSQILDLKFDPALNRRMTAAYARENSAALKAAGLEAGPGEVYLAHFLGPQGAIKVLRASPETPISQLMTPKQIAANKGVRWGGRALADFRVFDLVQWSRHKVRSAYGNAPPVDVPTYTPTSRGYTGRGQVRVGDDLTLDVLYEVVDASALTRASGEFQPRDRTRMNSDAWIADTAARLDPAQLMPSPNASMGAPIVGPDGMIESGNGRFGVIERAYERHPDRIAAYRAAIEQAGFAVPDGVARPVLIARRQTELTRDQRIQMTIDAQDSGVAQMTPTEVALSFGRAMTGPRLVRFDPALSLTDGGNGGFVRAMLEALPKSARNAMVTKEGTLNRHGEQLLREAIFARAWDDPDIVELFVEADPGELGSLMAALEKAVPEWAALKADIEAGTVRPEFDISGHVLDAMRMISAARTAAKRDGIAINTALNDLLATPDLLAGPIAPLTLALVRKFWRNGRAAPTDSTADFLTRYAADARKAGQGGGMFGDGPSPRDVLRTIDPETFGDLPEDLGPVRGFARKSAPEPVPSAAPISETGFDAGVTSPEAEALHLSIREDLDAPEPPVVDRAEIEAAAAELDGLFDELVELPEGSTARAADLLQDLRKLDLGGGEGVSTRDFLNDLDDDAGADALLQACGLGGDR